MSKGEGLVWRTHVNLLCRLLPSSASPVSSTYAQPQPAPLFPSKSGWDWKLLCDCQHRQIPSPSVRSFCVYGPERASAEDWTELLWNKPGGCGAPAAVALRAFVQRGQKKIKKNILVVYNLTCFRGFVFMAWLAKQLAWIWALGRCMLWVSLTTWWQNQPFAWRMTHGTCIVLYCIEIFYMKQVSWQ